MENHFSGEPDFDSGVAQPAEDRRELFASIVPCFNVATTGEEPLPPLDAMRASVESGTLAEFVAVLDDDELTNLFIACQRRKKVVDAELKELETLSKIIQGNPDQPGLIDRFVAKGIDKITKYGATVHFFRQLWARKHREQDEQGPESDELVRSRAIQALKKLPFGGAFIREDFSVQSLSAYFREIKKDAETQGAEWKLPAELAGAIDVVEDVSLRVRNSGK